MFLRRKKASSASDEELVQRLRRGEGAAHAALWDRYAVLLFGVAMKYLKDTERSKDLVMECFADLPTLIDRHEVHALRGWLHTVVRNRCLMLLRQATPHTRNADQLPLQDDNTDEQLLLEEGLENLERAMAQLNPAQHDCVRLFHLERLSYTEVAERTGLRVEQVRSHLQNGRRNLRSILDRRTPNHDH